MDHVSARQALGPVWVLVADTRKGRAAVVRGDAQGWCEWCGRLRVHTALYGPIDATPEQVHLTFDGAVACASTELWDSGAGAAPSRRRRRRRR